VASNAGVGIRGYAASATGLTIGAVGHSESVSGTGVVGYVNAATGNTYGVRGVALSTSGIAVYGDATATSGAAFGIYGKSSSTSGYGVRGEATTLSGDTYGVFGSSASSSGKGVVGTALAGSGTTYGVRGQSSSTSGRGMSGEALAATGTTYGVYGLANSTDGIAVHGQTAGANARSLSGVATGTFGKGVYAEATGTHSSVNAILSIGNNGDAYAGYFVGRVHVAGTLSKSSGSFKIDHPLDPENKYLYHSFVESPDMMNIYNGNITTDVNGYASVELPEWFDALNKEFRYQLTVIGTFAQAIVADKINHNKFTIRTDKPYIEVSWQVTGVRKDPYAEANRINVEVDKEIENRGKYLNPEVYGQGAAKGVNYPEKLSTNRE
jgi:hypothetical protein